ncbi:hypothetical protein MIB92_04160 [Aestuariirhabdus sp. Z084]|uniref:HD domain-containing protein n=1 Tax=Aestuariirhabdus haliotis TaxID=2918751 RepID=UPI00201B3F08|nr:hypothetical protein [Aestuariirhabdus haliotis]MCL6414833.1 hypothetical protein [Aestuariirhabdus haliotis]MCL6418765.1 hypothetical protein [Aestuariirhabdus haliotis]
MDQKRFIKLWQDLLANSSATPAEKAWLKITEYYSLKDRFYHTGDHICFCLTQLDQVIGELDNAQEVEMALWFHDVIYQMGSDSNEADSATLFCQLIGKNSALTGVRKRVSQLIMDTTHDTEPQTKDGCYLADIDISSLGLPWEEFLKDSDNVRKESPHLDDPAYRSGQRRFFESLLSKSSIFYTDYFYQRYELQARDNLSKLLEQPV